LVYGINEELRLKAWAFIFKYFYIFLFKMKNMKDNEESELLSFLKKLSGEPKKSSGNDEPFYNNQYDIIVQEGEFFSTEKWNEEEQVLIDSLYPRLKKSIKPSQCYYNSQLIIINDTSNKIKYHEGFFLDTAGFPIIHGWNSLNGKLLDFTLQYNGRMKFSDKSHIGIEVDKAWVLDRIQNKKNSISYLDNYEDGFPAIRNKYIKPSSK